MVRPAKREESVCDSCATDSINAGSGEKGLPEAEARVYAMETIRIRSAAMETVKGILSGRDMFSVEEHQSVADVARSMAGLHVGAILVVRDGELRGIFSERDLMTRVIVEGRDIEATKVSEVMTKDLSTVV